MQFTESNKFTDSFVAIANFQLLELRMETLPVGLISINEDGLIIAADGWSERLLGYERGSLRSKHIGTVFSDNGRTFIDIVNTKGPGYFGKKRVTTCTGKELYVKVAMATGLETRLPALQIIFTDLE
ncbi:hypothetical protein KF707_16675 [Candidatus Obscuribacterales bacterium]|nr:hypothetical protein [Candidatus Obscuribacterales bacterium]